MSTKLFVLGFPGSGKSTVSRYIVDYVQRSYKNWLAQRICDYNILYNMFKQDIKRKDFYPVKHGGFYVTNPTKYDDALKQLEKSANSLNSKENKLLVIEFARGDYAKALKLFQKDFFRNSSYLFLYADLNTCLERIAQRIKDQRSIDDHFVPEHSLERFISAAAEDYPESVCVQVQSSFEGRYSRFKIIDSSGSKGSTIAKTNAFTDEIIKKGALLRPWEASLNEEMALPNTNISSREGKELLWTPPPLSFTVPSPARRLRLPLTEN